MTTHQFEHPLNEKTRIYLRVEALLNQMERASTFSDGIQHQLFFRSLFDMLEIFEQIQLKSELAKDMEKQRLTYRSWLHVEGVDQEMLNSLLTEVDEVHRDLMSAERLANHSKKTVSSVQFVSALIYRVVPAVLICQRCTTGCICRWIAKCVMPSSGCKP